ncbi:MAG: hypothetical protein D3923_03175, partial [Candidatus Electrothrix sp. AR3]|nr:hypothetical protein [Candidatus Electrothrix sp. AR3]
MSFVHHLLAYKIRIFLLLVGGLLLLCLPSTGMAAKVISSVSTYEATAEARYQKVAAFYARLEQKPALGKKRGAWLKAIHELSTIRKQYPKDRLIPSCLYLTGLIYRRMYQRFQLAADLDHSVLFFRKLISRFPRSEKAGDALYTIAQIEQAKGNLRGAAKIYYQVIRSYPAGERGAQAKKQLHQLKILAESLATQKHQRVIPSQQPPPVPQAIFPLPEQRKIIKNMIPEQPPKLNTEFISLVPRKVKKKVQNEVADKVVVSESLLVEMVQRLNNPVQKVPQEQDISSSWQRKMEAVQHKVPAPKFVPTPTVVNKEAVRIQPQRSAAVRSEPTKKETSQHKVPPPRLISVPPLKKEAAPIMPPPKPEVVEAAERKASSQPFLKEQIEPSSDSKEKDTGPAPFFAAKEVEPSKKPQALLIKPVEKKMVRIKIIPPEVKNKAATVIAKQQLEQEVDKKTKPVKEKNEATISLSEQKATEQIVAKKSEKPKKWSAKGATAQSLDQQQPSIVNILPVQYWSSDKYSRVAVTTSGGIVRYQADLPKKDKGFGQLSIDFKQSYIDPKYRSPIIVENGLLKKIHTEQLNANTVRLFLEMDSTAEYKIFSLKDPFRVVVDFRGIAKVSEEVKEERPEEKKAVAVKQNKKTDTVTSSPAKLTLAQQLGLGIRRIMIDPGHGGRDSGASGFGLQEKRLVLDVAKRVKKILRQKYNYEVMLTREDDKFLPLEKRIAIANTKDADLFLSIHVNAHPKDSVKGVETFYLNLATNPEAMRVAARENATSTHNISEMQNILSDLMQNTKIDESSRFAEFIQDNMVEGL